MLCFSAQVDKLKHPDLWPLPGPERAFLEDGGNLFVHFVASFLHFDTFESTKCIDMQWPTGFTRLGEQARASRQCELTIKAAMAARKGFTE